MQPDRKHSPVVIKVGRLVEIFDKRLFEYFMARKSVGLLWGLRLFCVEEALKDKT